MLYSFIYTRSISSAIAITLYKAHVYNIYTVPSYRQSTWNDEDRHNSYPNPLRHFARSQHQFVSIGQRRAGQNPLSWSPGACHIICRINKTKLIQFLAVYILLFKYFVSFFFLTHDDIRNQNIIVNVFPRLIQTIMRKTDLVIMHCAIYTQMGGS